jgi:hypothetical protein
LSAIPYQSTLQQDVFDKEKFSKEDSKKKIKGIEAQNSNNTAKLLLHRDVLQGDTATFHATWCQCAANRAS